MILKCECGGAIVFEDKKTMTSPEEKRGVCLGCKSQYKLVDGILYKGGKSNGTK